jgi:hypothetical protein
MVTILFRTVNVPSPFTKSHFGMNLGIASASDFENIILEIEGEKIIGLKGSLIFADLNFDYQQKIKDWIAFYAQVGLTARIGTELKHTHPGSEYGIGI